MIHENVYLVLIMNLFFCFLSLSELTNLYGKALVAQRLKRLPPMWETRVRSLGWEESPGEGNGNPLQYSCLENPMDKEAWWATVRGVTKNQT